MIEQRLTKRLTDYWDRIKGGSPVPSVVMFNPETIDDLWQRCFQVSVSMENGKALYTYDFIGKDLEIIFGPGLVGQKVTEKLGFMPARKMLEQMDKALHNPFPVILEGQFINEQSKIIKYRACMLPFGSNKNSISHFVVGISWKSF